MARKEVCPNCNTKLIGAASFCPECGRPTPHATHAELLDYELGQWRRHIGRTAPAGETETPPDANGSSPVRTRTITIPEPVSVSADPAPAPPTPRRAVRLDAPRVRLRIPKRAPRPARRSRPERDRVIVLDTDDPFAYRACTTCERTDWIVRTTRNEDGTWNYWCVRCSRAFKTVVRIRHGVKPFVAAGSVVGALVATSLLMR